MLPDLFSGALTEWSAAGASIILLAAYHALLLRATRLRPHTTLMGLSRLARQAWLSSIIRRRNQEILAVQTLRNSTMAATFFASTAVLFIIGLLNLATQADTNPILQTSFHASSPALWQAKVVILVLDFFAAFFSFTSAIRLYNHLGYMVGGESAYGDIEHLVKDADILMLRAGQYYSSGMRLYYYCIPLVFWLFSPYLMLLATTLLVVVLYRVDWVLPPGGGGE
ncbi:DUF599 domain-containing protein [Parachitinimonas caeni]|uniref:DUF599 domain-containing protein n=1 Tax=Parachitinimonas caeni TaxID=3031301 RepID=A0ABT7E429_9NEIS|nr:DUF599 domain-containing protein [Parachitinimonas caeni]MDK2125637.1 DUF599 domain-containing protein [Parachitinimonas caeni]